jgi:SAM-dependent methyltransferase
MPVTRYSKPLDIRQHKKDWLSLDYLRKLQRETQEFCDFVMAHPRRLAVTRCYICGSSDRRLFGETYGIPYHECARCTHVYADIRLTAEDLVAYYREKYFIGTAEVDPERVDTRAHMIVEPKLRFISEFVRTGRRRWLDVGAGSGGAAACAREMGFEAFGLEPGAEARDFARKVFKLELQDHSIQEELAARGPGSFDVVSFFMVLEHVTDPAEQVAAAAQLLAPEGLLVIEVPTADSVSAMSDIAFPKQGLRQTVSSHIMNYTRGSLDYLVAANALDVEGRWFLGQDVFNLVIHMALSNPAFLNSRLCEYFLDNNDSLQRAIDETERSDEVILVARKRQAT